MNDTPPADGGKPQGRVRIDDVASAPAAEWGGNASGTGTLHEHGVGVVRQGSPFRGVPIEDRVSTSGGAAAIGELAMIQTGVTTTAPVASLIVMAFGLACYAWFPGGGLLVASLGVGLATLGLFSIRKVMATMLLVAHMAVFFGCYFAALA